LFTEEEGRKEEEGGLVDKKVVETPLIF